MQFDQLRRREFITRRGGAADRGAGAAGGDAGDRILTVAALLRGAVDQVVIIFLGSRHLLVVHALAVPHRPTLGVGDLAVWDGSRSSTPSTSRAAGGRTFNTAGGKIAAIGLVPLLPQTTALHALTAGAIGTMTLAVMTRASLGHTGRALVAGRGTTTIYVLITLAGFVAPSRTSRRDTLRSFCCLLPERRGAAHSGSLYCSTHDHSHCLD